MTAGAFGRKVLTGRRRRALSGLGLMVGLVVAAGLLAVSFGPVRIPVYTVWAIILSRIAPGLVQADWPPTLATIVLDVRLPRVILAGLVGSALAVAGATYQGLFRNPLADPYILGVASGAALGASIAIVALPPALPLPVSPVPLLAFTGAVLAVGAVYLFGRADRRLPTTTLILAGVAVGSFLSALNTYVMILGGNRVVQIIAWLLGGFTGATWAQVTLMLPYLLTGMLVLAALGYRLNVLQLDDDEARQLGVDVDRLRLFLAVGSALITAAAVAVSGIIGFVGLVVPHLVRLVYGPDYRTLLPLSALAGAGSMILADLAARTVLSPVELPVGVVTAFVGGPFFLFLLQQRKREVF